MVTSGVSKSAAVYSIPLIATSTTVRSESWGSVLGGAPEDWQEADGRRREDEGLQHDKELDDKNKNKKKGEQKEGNITRVHSLSYLLLRKTKRRSCRVDHGSKNITTAL